MKVRDVYTSPTRLRFCVFNLLAVSNKGTPVRLKVMIRDRLFDFYIALTHVKGIELPGQTQADSMVKCSPDSHRAFVKFLLSVAEKQKVPCGPFQ
jgi:hypothetical protein